MGKKQVKQKGEITMETINDIVAEMRIGDLCAEDTSAARPAYINDILASYANRIEAAWMREREAGAAAAQICGEIGDIVGREATTEKSSAVGNAAKLREAYEFAEEFLRDYGTDWKLHNKLCDMLKSALAAPLRNCDLYTVGEALRKYGFPTKIKPWGEKEWLDFCEWLVSEVEAEAKGE